ncbi:hypothetical protein [Streptomyces sp. NPDC091212]|uniref:hypothetical protein n=1 Tax=Streptomyces sp. NPDC091212 TaxID=3155191 RepID=UPI0034202C39
MAHDNSKETHYRSGDGGQADNEVDQDVILRAELLRIMNEHEADRITRKVGRIRPELVTEFGEAATAVLDHDDFTAYAAAMAEVGREADDAAFDALAYLRHHPDATPADAFTALTAPGAD